MDKQTEIEAAAFRQLLKHLDSRRDVQNIDLMILADFCRNCLSKWMVSEAAKLGENLSLDDARKQVYKMPYQEWKDSYQTKASAEQLAAFAAKTNAPSS